MVNMFLQILFPFLDILIVALTKRYKYAWDQGKVFNQEDLPISNTRCKSQWNYFEIYGGQNFPIELRYAFFRQVLVVCFLFGAGIPILFPIGFIAFLLSSNLQKYELSYIYKKPVNFENCLNERSIKHNNCLPILYASFGFWFYGNR